MNDVKTSFVGELERALDKDGGPPLGIGRIVIEAPREQLSRPGGLRELARTAARELRRRLERQ